MSRMLSDKDGDRVKAVYWDDEDNSQHDFSCSLVEQAHLSHEYYGDHSENWIVVTNVADDKETQRFNTNKLGTIVWWNK